MYYDIITDNITAEENSKLENFELIIRQKKKVKFLLLKDINFYANSKIDKKFIPGILFPKFDISKIRKNLDKIVFCNADENCFKYNEIDIIISGDILPWKSLKEMQKNYISYAFNFSEILNLTQSQRIKKLSIMQKNLRLLQKYKVNYIIGSFAKNVFEIKTQYSLFSYGKVIGMNDEEAKNAITENYEKILSKFRKRNDKFYITDGLRVIKLSPEEEKNFVKKMYGYY